MAFRVFHQLAEVGIRILDFALGAAGAQHPLAAGIHFEFLLGPFNHSADSRIRAKCAAFLAIVENRHIHLAAAMTMQNFRAVRLDFTELPIFMHLLLVVLDENGEEIRLVVGMGLPAAVAREHGNNRIVVPNFGCVRSVGVFDLNINFVFVVHQYLCSNGWNPRLPDSAAVSPVAIDVRSIL